MAVLKPEEARRRRALVHTILAEGFQPPGTRQAQSANSAVVEYARRTGLAYKTAHEQIRSGGVLERAGAPVDWTKYQPRPNAVPVPDGFPEAERPAVTHATSVLYGPDGEVKLVWAKNSVDQERVKEAIRATIQGFTDDLQGVHQAVAEPKLDTLEADRMSAIIIGDAHLGLYSWKAETGEDFDLEIATRDLFAAVERLIASLPQTEELLIAQLGDFYHLDTKRAETPQNRNLLDVDSRFPKVIRAGIWVLRYIITLALRKFKRVRIRNAAGNHDPTAAIWLNEVLAGYFMADDRVIIEGDLRPIWAHIYGECMIGITHGHAPKPDKMPGLMAALYPEAWGTTTHRYVWHGHIHHKTMSEHPGVVVESFRTLAAKDAFHSESGYHAGREMQAVVLHKKYGEVERHTANIWMLHKE